MSNPQVPISVCASSRNSASEAISERWHNDVCSQIIGVDTALLHTHLQTVQNCLRTHVIPMQSLQIMQSIISDVSQSVRNCHAINMNELPPIKSCSPIRTGILEHLRGCGQLQHKGVGLTACHRLELGSSIGMSTWVHTLSYGNYFAACQPARTLPALIVPCQWYSIEIDDVLPPSPYPCGKRPPYNKLPIAFKRKATKNTRQLPLPFKCWQDIATNTIPTLDTYMITNNIYAQVDGQEIQIFSADITSDVNGYCWQGSITIPPDDFVRLNLDERKQGQELNISIRINDETFVFMAEEYSDNRVFGQKSYTVKGRSTTAKLGADYAQIQGGIIEQPIYARQVADAQVATTGYRITEWALVDWYILGGVYSTVNKTPMGVISDIATAAGGFVCSHPSLPELSIRPLYRVKAWDIATTKPDVSVPSSVVISISGQKTVNAQYNGVFVMSTHSKGVGADVWRRGTDREPRAQLLSHALYTNEIICEAAGMNALSKSGVHKQETVTLPIANKYGLHRAELGQIWQIQESTGAWQGIVTGVTVSVKIEHDAPVVTQTINVDRYLGT